MRLKMHFAGAGDSLLLEFEDEENVTRRVLIDGGNVESEYKKSLRETASKVLAVGQFDLAIVTHYDLDHIKGIRWFLRDVQNGTLKTERRPVISELWVNSPKLRDRLLAESQSGERDLGYRDARALEATLELNGNSLVTKVEGVQAPNIYTRYGATFSILSPTIAALNSSTARQTDLGTSARDYETSLQDLMKKIEDGPFDSAPENTASIAFLVEHSGKSLLSLADAVPSVLDDQIEALCKSRGIERLTVDAVKLPHHGSIRNLSHRALKALSANKWIISTNGSKGLPNKATIAKLLHHRTSDEPVRFYFNYAHTAQRLGFTAEEKVTYRFEVHSARDGQELELIL